MGKFDLWRIGSFQRGLHFSSEDPRTEVWERLSRYGTEEYFRSIYNPPENHGNPDELIRYAITRVRQAIEFRESARTASLLTRPLPLYYSFLSLVRAFMLLRNDVVSTKAHGLRFHTGHSILDATAEVMPRGTVSELLKYTCEESLVGRRLSLRECLAEIIEIENVFDSPERQRSRVIPIRVKAWMSGTVILEVGGEYRISDEELCATWKEEFPTLKDCCELLPEGRKLRVGKSIDTSSYEGVCSFCMERLETSLEWKEDPDWYVVRRRRGESPLPRVASYLMAMFLLSSVVRYEPLSMLKLVREDTELGWFLRRFLSIADRFFPQLMICWLWRRQVFF